MADRGVLLIADISGYTKFVGGVELEHGAAIVADLLGVAVDQLAGVAALAKLEGDAAFCAGSDVPTAEALMAALFGCYDAFRRRLRDAAHLTTCSCAACSAMSSLDLKIVVHAGEYLSHRVAGSSELTGSDVILVHRLLKNSVSDTGYALFTEAAAQTASLPVAEWGCVPRTEAVDDVGPVHVHVLDLRAAWDAEQERASVVVGESDGKVMTFELPAPPPVVWEWFSDPVKRQQWNAADRIEVVPSSGASGVGTVNHCVHGKQTIHEEIVDWKPFNYCTLRIASPVGKFLMTCVMEPKGEGSVASIRMRPEGGGAKKLAFGLAYKTKISKDFTAGMSRLAELLSTAG